MKRLSGSVLLLVLAVTGQAQLKYTLTGKIGNLNAPAKIIMRYRDSAEKVIMDSVILKNGQFSFTGSVPYPIRAYLTLLHDGQMITGRANDAASVYLENGIIKISSKDSLKNMVITGSKLNNQYRALNKALIPIIEKYEALRVENAVYIAAKNDSKAMGPGMKEKYEAAAKERKATYKKFIDEDPSSMLALDMLSMSIELPYKVDELEPAYAALSPAVKNTPGGRKLAETIEKLKALGIGSLAPDFSQNDTSGLPVKLSSFRGKYVLVDFWASWCGPCRADNPDLVKNFNKYKDKNFTVLGVSLDQPTGKDKWIKAIHDDQLTWTHVSDLAFWDNAAAKLYAVNAIPQNYLVDPSGKIIGLNLHGAELDKKLNELLQ